MSQATFDKALLALLEKARADALEEAAKVAEDRGLGDAFLEPHQLVKAIAAAIRALKEKP